MKSIYFDKNHFYKIDGELMGLIHKIALNVDEENTLELLTNCGRLTEKIKNSGVTEIN